MIENNYSIYSYGYSIQAPFPIQALFCFPLLLPLFYPVPVNIPGSTCFSTPTSLALFCPRGHPWLNLSPRTSLALSCAPPPLTPLILSCPLLYSWLYPVCPSPAHTPESILYPPTPLTLSCARPPDKYVDDRAGKMESLYRKQ